MKGAVLLLLCTIAIAHAELNGLYNNGCPRDTSIEKLLPHENCDQYYQCLHGALLPRFCASGLSFNRKLQKCDWSADVKCIRKREEKHKNEKQSEELEIDSPTRICVTSDAKGLLIAHEQNCNQFYKCSFGKPILLTCAVNLLFNHVIQKCDRPENVDCTDREITVKDDPIYYSTGKGSIIRDSRSNVIESGNSDPSQAPGVCAASGSDGVLVAHENCKKFYKCFDGQPVAMNCPVNLLYNPSKEYCDWPRNVECGERVIPEVEDISDTDNGGNSSESEENVSSDEVDDDSNSISNSDPTQAPTICAAPKSEGVLVAHENCNQFYKCSRSRPVALNCPVNLMYNPSKEYCDWPKNVECGDRIIPDANDPDNNQNSNEQSSTPGGQSLGNHSDPSQAPTICAGQDSDGVLVAHENCNQFYKCDDGRPVALRCPGNLLYNSGKEYCDWPTDVECGDRIISEPDSDENNNENGSNGNGNGSGNFHGNPSEAPAICASYNSDGVLIAHENCNQFYKCFDGHPVALFCQPNLLYNPSKEYCDWPYNVECGNRLVPIYNNNNNSDEDNNNGNTVPTLCSTSPDGDLVPHENCSQFYKCLRGQTYPMDCPPGLYYNPDIKVCDWPVNVKCGDRLTETQAHKLSRRGLMFRRNL